MINKANHSKYIVKEGLPVVD